MLSKDTMFPAHCTSWVARSWRAAVCYSSKGFAVFIHVPSELICTQARLLPSAVRRQLTSCLWLPFPWSSGNAPSSFVSDAECVRGFLDMQVILNCGKERAQLLFWQLLIVHLLSAACYRLKDLFPCPLSAIHALKEKKPWEIVLHFQQQV